MTKHPRLLTALLLLASACAAQETNAINRKLKQQWKQMNAQLFVATAEGKIRLNPDGSLSAKPVPNCANFANVFIESIKVADNELQIQARRTGLPPQNRVDHQLRYSVQIRAALPPNWTDAAVENLVNRIFTPASPQLRPEKTSPEFHRIDETGMVPPRPLLKNEANAPDVVQQAKAGGNVWVEYTVNEDGTVSDIDALTTDPYGFSTAAAAIDSRMRFQPATLNGTPVKVRLRSEHVFCYF